MAKAIFKAQNHITGRHQWHAVEGREISIVQDAEQRMLFSLEGTLSGASSWAHLHMDDGSRRALAELAFVRFGS